MNRFDAQQRAQHKRLLELMDEQLAANTQKEKHLRYALRTKPEELRNLETRLAAARARIAARELATTGSV